MDNRLVYLLNFNYQILILLMRYFTNKVYWTVQISWWLLQPLFCVFQPQNILIIQK